jgi:hypothetical protein
VLIAFRWLFAGLSPLSRFVYLVIADCYCSFTEQSGHCITTAKNVPRWTFFVTYVVQRLIWRVVGGCRYRFFLLFMYAGSSVSGANVSPALNWIGSTFRSTYVVLWMIWRIVGHRQRCLLSTVQWCQLPSGGLWVVAGTLRLDYVSIDCSCSNTSWWRWCLKHCMGSWQLSLQFEEQGQCVLDSIMFYVARLQ